MISKFNFIKGKMDQVLTFLGVFILLFLISIGVQAQKVNELNAYFVEEGIEAGDRLFNFVYGATPTIVISDGSKVYPSELNPQKVDVDGVSLSILNDSDPLFRTVKMIQVHITDVSQLNSVSLKSTLFSSFPNLEFIHILSDVAMTIQDVSKMVTDFSETDVLIFYQVALPQ
ncbi:hypothetical protein MM213_05690 [Belliella sp. R4-6]|uniref:Uncharacterized protein n=1 Tax=Belliella alkalica TaxID=1730871 RepID=A0ABS9V9D5_9BACT|nr:hypothetical protein [Belliella alkalica]MCH7412963.1 hypothetical protein [Belliella alkalica]